MLVEGHCGSCLYTLKWLKDRDGQTISAYSVRVALVKYRGSSSIHDAVAVAAGLPCAISSNMGVTHSHRMLLLVLPCGLFLWPCRVLSM